MRVVLVANATALAERSGEEDEESKLEVGSPRMKRSIPRY
jgi:hypothetical protein